MFYIFFYLTCINSLISQLLSSFPRISFSSGDFAWRMFTIRLYVLKIRASFWSIFAMQTTEVIGFCFFVFDFLNVGLHNQRYRPKDNRQIVVLTSHILATSTRKTVYLEAYQLLWHRYLVTKNCNFLFLCQRFWYLGGRKIVVILGSKILLLFDFRCHQLPVRI